MKRLLLSAVSLLIAAVAAFATPAYPGKITLKGENGQPVKITLHGDEFCHWATDASGREVSISRDGIVRQLPATRAGIRSYSPAWHRVYSPTPSAITRGNNHFLVILVEFADQSFVLDNPQDRFTRLLNENGYADNGATGSVHDYY